MKNVVGIINGVGALVGLEFSAVMMHRMHKFGKALLNDLGEDKPDTDENSDTKEVEVTVEE